MPDVLYPEDLHRLGVLFDQVSAQLAKAGVDYSPENLARRLIECAEELALWPQSVARIVRPVPHQLALH